MKTKRLNLKRTQTINFAAAKHDHLLNAVTWDVFAPPPSNSVKGKLMPSALSRYRHRRKLSVEVHKKYTNDGSEYEVCVLRVLVPLSKANRKQAINQGISRMKEAKSSVEEFTSMRRIQDEEDDDDDQTIHTMGTGMMKDTGGKDFEGWKPRYRIPVASVIVQRTKGRSLFVSIDVGGGTTQNRELIFDTEDDGDGFHEKMNKEQEMEEDRKLWKIEAALGGIKLPKFETVSLLIEIVSCWDIPAGDAGGTSDPYVVVMMGEEQIHQTSVIYKTLDPIYTLKTGSLFILTVDSFDLFKNGGLSFLVEDHDDFSSNDLLGVASVPAKELYQARGARMEYEFNTKGHIAIRCRRATDYDKDFLTHYEESRKMDVAKESPKTNSNDILSMVAKKSKKVGGERLYKVRPNPDPQEPEETEWMSDAQINDALMAPSRHWVDSGTGDLGKIHLEILECIGLPNLDVGGFLGNKTDAFVAVVYEDAYVITDTIDDCLSPRWLPWSKRAFTLRTSHPSSRVNVGVFDYDPGLSDHDLIGRISIDLTNLQKDTEYILSYNLYPSSQIEGRKSEGVIRVRLRKEIPDERLYALTGIEPPRACHINVGNRKEFRVVRQTCIGAQDYERFSFHIFMSYVNELRAYQHVFFYLEDSLGTLLLWRGHFPVNLGFTKLYLPLHSMAAFVVAICLVERPELIPSFTFGSIAWVMMAINGWRKSRPNLWARCTSFRRIALQLLWGRSPGASEKIEPYENWDASKSEIDKFMDRIKEAQRLAQVAEEKAAKENAKFEREEKERLEDLKEMDATTKTGGLRTAVDPVAQSMLPFQIALGMVCRCIRFAKNVLIWEEAYFSFWVVAACMFTAVVCLLVPWFFLIKWGSRMFVWTFFGPWMKLLDIYSYKIKDLIGDEDVWEQMQAVRNKDAKSDMRVRKEDAKKMQTMKEHMFGKYSVSIPVLKLDRYADIPLPESSATPYQAKELTLAELAMEEAGYKRTRVPGQNLVGKMIPQIAQEEFTAAPTGQAILNFNLLSPASVGPGLIKAAGSTRAAYIKIGSIIAAAGVLTVFGVPFLGMCTEWVFAKVLHS